MVASIAGSKGGSFASPLSSLLSLAPLEGQVTIIPVKETGGPLPTPIGPPYVVMFNPESLSVAEPHRYNVETPPGGSGSVVKYESTGARNFNFEFLIDGTGASGDKREVLEEVNKFKLATGFFGDLHRPAYLVLIWGTFIVKCVMTTMETRYTLFRKNGSPLRATIAANFTEYTTREENVRLLNLASPDLTQFKETKAGDKLPLLSFQVYEDSRYFMEIARVNGIVNLRKLETGQRLVFPPLEK